ncbi:3-hydroxyacyl-CoA dehydrogenase NAD-binding domain-containing protein, partial [Mycobacterium sp.]|uniref:3-hydroxyacyl-CoA dehydrogenase NAD-binding domain-containing protein n=1 Tax=Mycobacterium sp. TaxID=1785 RepID=UPI003C707AFC
MGKTQRRLGYVDPGVGPSSVCRIVNLLSMIATAGPRQLGSMALAARTRIRGGLVTVPQDYLDRPVAVVGAGTLGRRVALMFTSRGGLVRIIARRAAQGAEAVDFVEQQIGVLSGTHPRWERGRAEYVERLEDTVAGAWLVIESVPERLELKQVVFALLESAAEPD